MSEANTPVSLPAVPEHDPQPEAPQPPAPGDCCHSGCTYCVEDMYQGELDRYRVALREWQERQSAAQQKAGDAQA
ncbi:oxidoreductase-like domain-containing protein [Duganella qianjiadongensis]|uniref:Oxidoreductase-like protein n=1 Tax=Duganella qianjiadongensis TaxID=2692176 RepID=A0ABW9VM42_9BURK|nr:oxidoreductase-like domain-containing protein [Duganella qianjiadongensis]MYM38717.1 oxidoreductase-like protein [Duganella qianjiadongensis]